MVLLAFIHWLGVDYPRGATDDVVFFGALALLTATTAVLHWYQVRRAEKLVSAMLWALPLDLICVAVFTYLFQNLADAFYPVAMLLPAVYALYVDKQSAWAIGMASAAAYSVAHLSYGASSGAQFVSFAAAAAAIPVLAGAVAAATERRRLVEVDLTRVAAERAAAIEQLGQRVGELQAVSQITEMIHSSLDFDSIGPQVMSVLAKVIGLETCCLFVIDKERSETLFSANTGLAPAQAMRPDGSLDYSGLDDHFSCIPLHDVAGTMVLLCAPAEGIEHLRDDDRLVMAAVASELAVAVENSRLYRLTKQLAVTDELTGLANYRHLQNRLDEEIERARRYEKSISLIMIDVDDFKGFNDTYGHLAGDQALAELASVLSAAVREVDLVARYGGEEFSLVLPETDGPGAFVVAEKLREAVAGHLFGDSAGVPLVHMTVSMGTATYPAHARDKESLLREADDALYRAKNGGKNRVCTARGVCGAGPPAHAEDSDGDGDT